MKQINDISLVVVERERERERESYTLLNKRIALIIDVSKTTEIKTWNKQVFVAVLFAFYRKIVSFSIKQKILLN